MNDTPFLLWLVLSIWIAIGQSDIIYLLSQDIKKLIN